MRQNGARTSLLAEWAKLCAPLLSVHNLITLKAFSVNCTTPHPKLTRRVRLLKISPRMKVYRSFRLIGVEIPGIRKLPVETYDEKN